jgi:hypothetical protein
MTISINVNKKTTTHVGKSQRIMNNAPLRAIRRAVWLHMKSSFKGNVCTLTGIHMERKGIYVSYGMFGLYAGCPSSVERYVSCTRNVLSAYLKKAKYVLECQSSFWLKYARAVNDVQWKKRRDCKDRTLMVTNPNHTRRIRFGTISKSS